MTQFALLLERTSKRYNGSSVVEQPEKQNLVEELLSRAGLSSSLLQKVRFRGPVGKLALVGVSCFLVLGGVGVRSSDAFVQGLCVTLATIVVLGIGGAILWYSHEHPDQATLEGMEVIVMQQQKFWAEAAAKGLAPAAASALQLTVPNPPNVTPEEK